MPSLSAAMVVMDEELLIDLSIKSAKHFVDEFVIVDNGCSDRTIEIAKRCVEEWSLKARFFEFEGTLKDARAFSFEQCDADWIFLHDGDHVLQTKGKHSIYRAKKLMKSNPVRTWRFPLVRLYYNYFLTQKDLQVQPPHKLLFCNNPKRWQPALGTRNIPHTTIPMKVAGLYSVWNICIKRPDRILERQFWGKWRQAGRPGTVRDFIIRKKNLYPKQFENYAEYWLTSKVFYKRGYVNAKVDEFGGHPAVIQEEIDAGINRTSMDTAESIRLKRLGVGLSDI